MRIHKFMNNGIEYRVVTLGTGSRYVSVPGDRLADGSLWVRL